MNRRIASLYRNISLSLLLLPAAVGTMYGQAVEESAPLSEPARPPAPVVMSAKDLALMTFGTIPDLGREGKVVDRVVYVKLRGVEAEQRLLLDLNRGITLPPAVDARMLTIASAAGVMPVRATRMASSLVAVDKEVASRRSALPALEQAAAARAEAELGRIVELHYATEIHPREAAMRLMKSGQVEYAEPVIIPRLLAPASPNDPEIWRQYSLPQVRAYDAWEIWQGDTSMVIGIVDAGIDMFHEDLAPNIQENPGETGTDGSGKDKRTNGIDDDDNGAIDDWRGANLTSLLDGSVAGDTRGNPHGTAVTGIAAAATNNGKGIAGVANRCRFFPIKAARSDNYELTHAYEGLVYAAKRGFKVINCSWGDSERSRVLEDLVANLVLAYDVAIVAAAGNDPFHAQFFPAGFNHVLGVGAVGSDDRFLTSWGEHVGISAPIGYTTTNDNQYTDVGLASSYSSPFVTGAMALVRSRFPQLSADQAIAHVRLTADNVEGRNPGIEKMAGYGRLNIQRALTTDPFSHPAIVIDTLFLTTPDGSPHDDFIVGANGTIRVRLKNLLGDARNVRVRIVTYDTTNRAVEVSADTLEIAEMASGETVLAGKGVRFHVASLSDTRIGLRVEITADGDYADYDYDRALFTKPYLTAVSRDLRVSFTSRGRLGFHDYPHNSIGEGVLFRNSSFLYEGGLIVAGGMDRIISTVRGSNSSVSETDLIVTEMPGAANDSTMTMSDSIATGGRGMGLEFRARLITSQAAPNAVGLQLRTRNVSAESYDSLRIGLFMDWDLHGNAGDQRVAYESNGATGMAFHGRITGPEGYSAVAGVALPARNPIFYAIRNNGDTVNIYNGFALVEKWRVLSNGVGAASAGPADVSLVIGHTASLAPGSEDTTLFVIGVGGPGEDPLEAARRFTTGTSDVVAEEAPRGNRNVLGHPSPNPFNRNISIDVRPAHRGALLRVFDSSGREVADLSGRIPSDNSAASITFDAASLPSGLYYIRYSAGDYSESRQVLLIR